jgi:opacity protein-like surface antigen
MKRTTTILLGLTGGMISATCGSAYSADLLGLYVGAGLGQSQVAASASLPADLSPYHFEFSEHHFAYDAMVGFRPISFLGAEVSYLNLGHPSGSLASFPASVSMKGEAAFAVLYLPIPIIDVYAKAGVARIQSSASGHYNDGIVDNVCIAGGVCGSTAPLRLNETNRGFAEGAGIQYKIGACAIRGEFERFNAEAEHPRLISLGVTWTFF